MATAGCRGEGRGPPDKVVSALINQLERGMRRAEQIQRASARMTLLHPGPVSWPHSGMDI